MIDSNLINIRALIRKYWWEKALKSINVRRTFIRHLRVVRVPVFFGSSVCRLVKFVGKKAKKFLFRPGLKPSKFARC